jgi:hypothetical protein
MEITIAARNAAGTALTVLLNTGSIQIRTGASPGVDSAATGTLLGTLPLSATAFGTWAAGSATANAITQDASADATGTAGYFRALDSGSGAVIDGTVTATGGGGDLELNSVSITSGGTIDITSWVINHPA